MTRIVLADDHALFREGLVRLLQTAPDLEVVGVAGSGAEALDLVFERKPDLLLLDLSMPDMDGHQVAARLGELRSAPRVVFLTMHRNRSAMEAAMRHRHACGYVVKESAFEELLEAVRTVMAGGEYVSAVLAADRTPPPPELTARELEVLRLTARGGTTHTVAARLGISCRTVENHRAHIMQKLAAANMVAAVGEATKRGLL